VADQTSFDDFFLGTRGELTRQLTAMTADPELARDVLQEAYARAWQRWSRVSTFDNPVAWVRTVAWRLAVSHFRRVAVAERALRALRVRSDQLPPSAVDEALDVRDALRRLSPEQRRALVLHDLCGMTMDQVADETGVSIGTVKSRLSRGRAALTRVLGPAYSASETVASEREEGR
jgi:RNA polymerase sigma-70 factor (ECF subfamily)